MFLGLHVEQLIILVVSRVYLGGGEMNIKTNKVKHLELK